MLQVGPFTFIQWGFKPRLKKVKPPADATDFQRKFNERSSIKSGRKYAKAHLIYRTNKLRVLEVQSWIQKKKLNN
ncbi:hypothetical protein [Siminovitchia terrae]|uniref:hypothetical protein n=1 Tax=Siminovitchia terrae TaxID=1914933 RepID=UPI001BB4064A|nr:hypothetical protein [Siminovitchia terrae]